MVSLRSAHRQLTKMRDIVDDALEDFVQEKMASNQAPAMSLAREVLLAGGKTVSYTHLTLPTILRV